MISETLMNLKPYTAAINLPQLPKDMNATEELRFTWHGTNDNIREMGVGVEASIYALIAHIGEVR